MKEGYNDWLRNRVVVRDSVDVKVLNKMLEYKLKGRYLRKVDDATRTVALSLRDDYIFETHVEFPNPETRYNGNISLLEFIFGVVWPYEYCDIEGYGRDKVYYKRGNPVSEEKKKEFKIDKRSTIFWALVDEFRKHVDNPLVFSRLCDDFNKGEFRAFLANKIPLIEKFSISDQFKIYLWKHKLIKMDKDSVNKLIYYYKALDKRQKEEEA